MKKISKTPESVIKGVNLLGDTVGSTLGALGHTVFIEDEGLPVITKDGYSVSRFVKSSDKEEQLGIQVVYQAAKRTADDAGDGTTTSTVLAQAIINGGFAISEYPSAKIVDGVKAAAKDVSEELEKAKLELDSESLVHIAKVSTNNDDFLGNLIADVFEKCGEYGGIDFQEDHSSTITRAEHTAGSMLPIGFSKPAMINNAQAKACILKNPFVLVSNSKIRNIREISALTEHAIEEGRDLLIIGDTADEVDETLIANRVKGNLNSCVLKTQQFTEPDMLKDLAALIGATYVDSYTIEDNSLITPDMLGEMSEVSVMEWQTIFNTDKPCDVEDRKIALKKEIDTTTNELKKRDLQERLGVLSSSFGKILVGAPTPAERKEIYHRVEDAVKAIVTAKKFGYLPGGGVTLRDISNKLVTKKVTDGYSFGYNAVLTAIKAPYLKILENAGIVDDGNHKEGCGYNVLTGEKVNMIEAGIIDPAGVTMQSLVNAVSSSIIILGTKYIITNESIK